MRAVKQHRQGGADQLYIGEVERPAPGVDEILVKVKYAALNRADILQREGKYPPPPGSSEILGLELSGVVEVCGEGVTEWKPGDRVFGLVPGGAQAEWAVIHKRMALPLPNELGFEKCAAIPEVFLTAYQALVWLAKVKKGEKVVIHAGGSGVGTAGIQLARFFEAEPFVTASMTKHNTCIELGANAAFDYNAPDFWERIREKTGGVDIIVDPVGGKYFGENLNLLNRDGRLIMLAAMGGIKTESVNVGQIVFKRIQIQGTTLRSRSLGYQIALTQDFWSRTREAFIQQKLKPVIDRVFPLDQIQEAHQFMEGNRNIGKILLKIS